MRAATWKPTYRITKTAVPRSRSRLLRLARTQTARPRISLERVYVCGQSSVANLSKTWPIHESAVGSSPGIHIDRWKLLAHQALHRRPTRNASSFPARGSARTRQNQIRDVRCRFTHEASVHIRGSYCPLGAQRRWVCGRIAEIIPTSSEGHIQAHRSAGIRRA